MTKKTYSAPAIQVIQVDNASVICQSPSNTPQNNSPLDEMGFDNGISGDINE